MDVILTPPTDKTDLSAIHIGPLGGRAKLDGMKIKSKRVYDEAERGDGARILVDRLWPRGVAKDDLPLDGWNKDVAPSTELRKRFVRSPDDFEEFAQRYRDELATDDGKEALDELRRSAKGGILTLLTAKKDVAHSHIPVLVNLLRKNKSES